jgi:hypothetical protein
MNTRGVVFAEARARSSRVGVVLARFPARDAREPGVFFALVS